MNTDPPLIVDIWRRQQPLRAVVESVSRATLDKHVFAKPYFDRFGLIMALDEGRPVGFVHAGFGPTEDLTDIDTRVGIISQLKVAPGENDAAIASDLLERAVGYLKSKGAKECHGGSRFPHAPFYLGLYGGSRIPGVLVSDVPMVNALKAFGFVEAEEIVILNRTLAGFRVSVDRHLINVRRQFQIAPVVDPLERSWWESCTLGMADRDSFTICDRKTKTVAGRLTFWDMLPLAHEWGVQARGIYDLRISPEHRGGSLETFLLGESLKQLKEQGIGLVEAQTSTRNVVATAIFAQLGFEESGRGIQLSKEI